MEELITWDGTVHSIIFQNAENGYTVLRLLTEEGEVVTVVGCIPCVAPGEHLTVSGVEDVERFDENCIVMATCVGTLVVTGEDLHIGKLSLDGGELHVDGHIDAVNYEEQAVRHSGLLSRLFG